MKVMFNCHVPFMLAHGGMQVQIVQTKAALEQIGVKVEPLRWWDEGQTADVLHHFGTIPVHLLRLAQQKGIKVVMSPFMGALGARPGWRRTLQKFAIKFVKLLGPEGLSSTLGWEAFQLADACVAMT